MRVTLWDSGTGRTIDLDARCAAEVRAGVAGLVKAAGERLRLILTPERIEALRSEGAVEVSWTAGAVPDPDGLGYARLLLPTGGAGAGRGADVLVVLGDEEDWFDARLAGGAGGHASQVVDCVRGARPEGEGP